MWQEKTATAAKQHAKPSEAPARYNHHGLSRSGQERRKQETRRDETRRGGQTGHAEEERSRSEGLLQSPREGERERVCPISTRTRKSRRRPRSAPHARAWGGEEEEVGRRRWRRGLGTWVGWDEEVAVSSSLKPGERRVDDDDDGDEGRGGRRACGLHVTLRPSGARAPPNAAAAAAPPTPRDREEAQAPRRCWAGPSCGRVATAPVTGLAGRGSRAGVPGLAKPGVRWISSPSSNYLCCIFASCIQNPIHRRVTWLVTHGCLGVVASALWRLIIALFSKASYPLNVYIEYKGPVQLLFLRLRCSRHEQCYPHCAQPQLWQPACRTLPKVYKLNWSCFGFKYEP